MTILCENNEWRPVVGFEGFYEVSRDGRIKRLPRRSHLYGGRYVNYGERLLKDHPNGTGYRHVVLTVQGAKKHAYVHRLVAMSFCDGYDETLDVNHKNGNRSDNRAENLEWVTRAQNLLHCYRVLKTPHPCIGKTGFKAKTGIPIVATEISTGIETVFGSISDAARQVPGFCGSSISEICKGGGRRKTHKGYRFRYADI